MDQIKKKVNVRDRWRLFHRQMPRYNTRRTKRNIFLICCFRSKAVSKGDENRGDADYYDFDWLQLSKIRSRRFSFNCIVVFFFKLSQKKFSAILKNKSLHLYSFSFLGRETSQYAQWILWQYADKHASQHLRCTDRLSDE